MFDNKDLLSENLRNPLDIQYKALEELENRTKGTYTIADSNSSFCNLLEFGSSIAAACMQEIDNVIIPGIYAKRAQTFKSISRHMSDFDYVNLFSTPSSVTLVLQLDTITLMDQALDYNEYYKKAVIPEDSVFTIGSYEFGIYYPIEIQINKLNGNILVTHNVNEEHPLHKLTTNILEHKTQTFQGVPMLSFSFPAYQFSKSWLKEDITASIGFSKSYTYNNYFYACRIYTYFAESDKWVELSQTTSDILYDVSKVTAKLLIEPDNHKVTVTIPQIYFDSGQMGTKLLIELYTTQGELNVDISQLPSEAFTASFFNRNSKNYSKFSDIFKQYPSLQIYPRSTKIYGGNNSLSFEEIRNRVINNISHRTLLITPTDIEKYFEDNNFKVIKYLDNISNRIYFCNAILTDSDNSYIPVTNSYVRLTEDVVNSTKDIVKNQSSSVTILPTAIYQYQTSSNQCTILSDSEKAVFENMEKEKFVNTLNTYVYTKSPFHVKVSLPPSRYQTAISYNLFDNKVLSIQYKYDHEDIMAQMTGYSASINHDNDGSDGYTIRFIVAKSVDLEEIPEEDILVFVCIKDTLGSWCGKQATFLQKQDDYYIYELKLKTDYQLEDNTINFTNLDFQYETLSHTVKLEDEWVVVYSIKNSQVPNINNDYKIVEGLPASIQNEYIGMGRQIFTIHLGHHLDDIIYNICDFSWEKQQYKTYDTDVVATYQNDIYELNEDGTIKVTVEDNQVKLNKLHSAGETIMDDNDNLVYLHRKGDYVYDPNGNLILSQDRKYECLVHMMQFDARLFYSEDPAHINFIQELPLILESYFSIIETAKDKILEETKLYFRPIRTIGTSLFSIGDGRTSNQQLDMSFRMKLHVPQFVKNDETLQNEIRDNIITITEEAIARESVSMTDIANIIKEKLSSYIDNIDVLGINGDSELQTIHVLDNDAQSSIARILVILKDNTLTLEKDVTLEFVATEQTLYT